MYFLEVKQIISRAIYTNTLTGIKNRLWTKCIIILFKLLNIPIIHSAKGLFLFITSNNRSTVF